MLPRIKPPTHSIDFACTRALPEPLFLRIRVPDRHPKTSRLVLKINQTLSEN
jgi:hypothetical protein